MSSAVKFVLATAILALAGGYALMGAMTQRPSEEPLPPQIPSASASPSTEPTPTPSAPIVPTPAPTDEDADQDDIVLPVEIPDGVPSGRLKTPLGWARWVHLSGDQDTLPPMFFPLSTPSGYLIIDPGEGNGSCQGPCRRPAIWRSADLMSWDSEPLPVEADGAWLARSGGDYWLATDGPATLWRSSDASTWAPIDLSHLQPSGPPGLDWEIRLGIPSTSGSVVAMPVHYLPVDPASYLGLTLPDGGDIYLRAVGPGLFHAFVRERHVATIRFEESGGGLRVEASDGSDLAVLDDVSLETIERWATSGTPFEPEVGLLQGERLSPVDLPGAPSGWAGTSLFGSGSGLYAFQPEGDDAVHVWRSSDGRTWTDTGVLGDDDGEPPRDSNVYANTQSVTARGHLGEWESRDGVTWHKLADGNGLALAGARIMMSKDSLAVRLEGEEAPIHVDLDKLDVRTKLKGGFTTRFDVIGPSSLGYMLSSERGEGVRHFWIIAFEELQR